MKTKLLAVALFASAALIIPAQAGNRGGGGRSFGSAPGHFGGGPSFHSMPMRSYGGNRAIYSGRHFSPVGPRVARPGEFRPGYVNRNPNLSIPSRQFVQRNENRGVDNARFGNRARRITADSRRPGNGAIQPQTNIRPD